MFEWVFGLFREQIFVSGDENLVLLIFDFIATKIDKKKSDRAHFQFFDFVEI